MPWPPKVGDPLPRAASAWYTQSKLGWILGEEGHGPEWEKVFHVTSNDSAHVWKAIAEAALGSTIQVVRDRSPFSWHYAIEIAPPRLVTAFPTP